MWTYMLTFILPLFLNGKIGKIIKCSINIEVGNEKLKHFNQKIFKMHL